MVRVPRALLLIFSRFIYEKKSNDFAALLFTWRGTAAEGRSSRGRQSARRLPFAQANQRPGDAHLNTGPGSSHPLQSDSRGGGAKLCEPIGGAEAVIRHPIQPMGVRQAARRLPAGRLAAAGELPGSVPGEPRRGGSWGPRRRRHG